MENVSRRNTGVDFLRIVSMYFVVLLHVQGNGGISDVVEESMNFTSHGLIVMMYQAVAYCAVNCFGLITGYVMVQSGYKVKNLIFLWMQVFFYSFGFTMLAAVTGHMDPDRTLWLTSLFPVLGERYWYFSAYFFMMLFAPVAIYAVNHMPQKLLRNLLITVVLLVSMADRFTELDPFCIKQGYSPVWLFVLFLIGGYLRRYGVLARWTSKKLFSGYLVCTGVTWILEHVSYLPQFFYCPILECFELSSYTSVTVLGAAVMLFLCLERLTFDKRMTKLTQALSPFAFGVYLVHTHPAIYWPMNWRFYPYLSLPAWGLALAVPLTAAVIYLAGTLIEWLRSLLFRALRLNLLADWAAKRIAAAGEWIGGKCA